MSEPMPVAFVGHGAPTLALDTERGEALAAWARRLPAPQALLVVSAHWEAWPPRIGTTVTRPLIYDFHGFPPALYRVQYPAPGAPALARRVRSLLEAAGVTVEAASERGLDHGVWVPLVHMYPAADVPVLQVSLPPAERLDAALALGHALAALRAEEVLILGSGSLVHNLSRLDFSESPPPSWASAFDTWCRDALRAADVQALVSAPRLAPDFSMAHPRAEHYAPLIVAAGATAPIRSAEFPLEGFEYGSLSRRCVELR